MLFECIFISHEISLEILTLEFRSRQVKTEQQTAAPGYFAKYYNTKKSNCKQI